MLGMSFLLRFAVSYGRTVHSWNKRQIHLCLLFDGHTSGHYFSLWCAHTLLLLSNFLKSAASFTRYITILFCLLQGWKTSTLYCNLVLRPKRLQPLFLFCLCHHLYLAFFFQISLGGQDWINCMTVKSKSFDYSRTCWLVMHASLAFIEKGLGFVWFSPAGLLVKSETLWSINCVFACNCSSSLCFDCIPSMLSVGVCILTTRLTRAGVAHLLLD